MKASQTDGGARRRRTPPVPTRVRIRPDAAWPIFLGRQRELQAPRLACTRCSTGSSWPGSAAASWARPWSATPPGDSSTRLSLCTSSAAPSRRRGRGSRARRSPASAASSGSASRRQLCSA
ncbi:hypothetical protein VPH35_078149 [Triticum aestivum]